MANRSGAGKGRAANLFILAGVMLIIAGVVVVAPSLSSSEISPEPADFGEGAPPLRPTVTPLPFASQQTLAPVELPYSVIAAANPPAEAPALRPLASQASAVEIPTRLIIPAIKLDAPIETVGWHAIDGVSTWDVPDHFAAGWLKTSAPLGQPGNTVLDGHHNIAGEVFRHLVDLRPGDEIEAESNGKVFFYKVITRQILLERGQPDALRLKNAQWMQPTQDERLTLITCWPYTSNSHRLIIVARPVDPERLDSKPPAR